MEENFLWKHHNTRIDCNHKGRKEGGGELQGVKPRLICTQVYVHNNLLTGKMFSEVYNLIRLYLTAPMTSATAERTLSTLRKLNITYKVL